MASIVASWRRLRLATETCRSIKTIYCAISWNKLVCIRKLCGKCTTLNLSSQAQSLTFSLEVPLLTTTTYHLPPTHHHQHHHHYHHHYNTTVTTTTTTPALLLLLQVTPSSSSVFFFFFFFFFLFFFFFFFCFLFFFLFFFFPWERERERDWEKGVPRLCRFFFPFLLILSDAFRSIKTNYRAIRLKQTCV